MRHHSMIGFVPSVDLDAATMFYRDTLGFELCSLDKFALEFVTGDQTFRVVAVGELTPQPFTILGWISEDIRADVERLAALGVAFLRYEHFDQDETGIWSAPGGARVAWFNDTDGNVLSLTQR